MANEETSFIDILLVIMGLVLAADLTEIKSTYYASVFYYALFAFLTFTIALRALVTFNYNDSSIWSIIIQKSKKGFPYVIAGSFAIVFVLFFYAKLSPQIDVNVVVFLCFVAITIAVSFYIGIILR